MSKGPHAPKLSAEQRAEILRLRSNGRSYKEIARAVPCTYDQAKALWRGFCLAGGIPMPRGGDKGPGQALRVEVAMARFEAAGAEPFKRGPLQW
jgi:hypothetical protein